MSDRATVLIVLICVIIGAFFAWGITHPAERPSSGGVAATTTSTSSSSTAEVPATTTPTIPESPCAADESCYIEITNGCGPYYSGTCVNLRSGPGRSFPSILHLRTGVVLHVATTSIVADGYRWYRVVQDQWLRYPERAQGNWYVAAVPNAVHVFEDSGDELLSSTTPKTTKRIVVDLSQQRLRAYDGDTLFMEARISTGLDGTPTPIGTFRVFKKTPSRYMQGPIPGLSDQYYDLPGVPWNLYFTQDGAVIHGAYWHDHFGEQWSHGCVNLPPDTAKMLYEWAPAGTTVTVIH